MSAERYALLLEEEKKDLFDAVLLHFDLSTDSRPNMDQVEQALGYDRDTIRKNRKGEIETLSLDLADSMYRILNFAEPAIELNNPGKYAEDNRARYAREGMREVDDFAQEWVFKRLSYGEFEELTGKSRSAFNRYRKNKTKRIELDVFEEAASVVEEKMSQDFPGNAILLNRKRYQTTEGDTERSQLNEKEYSEAAEKFPWIRKLETENKSLHAKFRNLFVKDGDPQTFTYEQEASGSRLLSQNFD